jgi:AAT family amino acid transporter
MKFRKRLTDEQVKKLKFPMIGYPYCNWIALAFLIFVVFMMFFNHDTLIALIIAPIWFAILLICYYALGFNKKAKANENK